MLWLNTSGRAAEHGRERLLLDAEEVGRQQLDGALRQLRLQRADHGGEVARAAILDVVAIDRRDDDVLQPHLRCRLGQAERLERVGRVLRAARVDVAVAAGAGAGVTEDLERRRALAPALGDVRAARLLAHGVQARAVDQLLDVEVAAVGARRPHLHPRGTARALGDGQRRSPSPPVYEHGAMAGARAERSVCAEAAIRLAMKHFFRNTSFNGQGRHRPARSASAPRARASGSARDPRAAAGRGPGDGDRARRGRSGSAPRPRRITCAPRAASASSRMPAAAGAQPALARGRHGFRVRAGPRRPAGRAGGGAAARAASSSRAASRRRSPSSRRRACSSPSGAPRATSRTRRCGSPRTRPSSSSGAHRRRRRAVSPQRPCRRARRGAARAAAAPPLPARPAGAVTRAPLVGLLAANAISITGNRLTQLAIPWFVLQTTGSVAKTGLVGFFSLLPFVHLVRARRRHRRPARLPPGEHRLGSRERRHGARRPASLPHRRAARSRRCSRSSSPGRCSTRPARRPARRCCPTCSSTPDMTLERGTSLFDGVSRAANMLGAPLAGVLIAVVGPTNVLVLDAATFAASALIMLALVPPPARARCRGRDDGYLAQLREGYRFLWRTPIVRAIVIMVLVTNTLDAGMGGVLMPVYADSVLDSVVALGLMAGAMGLTAFAGTLVFAWIGHRAPRVATLVIGLHARRPVPLLPPRRDAGGRRSRSSASRSRGSGSGPINPILGTLGYERVPPELRARVFGALSAGVMAGAPIGALLAAACVELAGLQATLIGFGVVYLVCTLSPLVVPAWRDAGRPARSSPTWTAGRFSGRRASRAPAAPRARRRPPRAAPRTRARRPRRAPRSPPASPRRRETVRPSSRLIVVNCASSSPHAVIQAVNGAGSRSTLSAYPCVVTQRETCTPIEASLRGGPSSQTPVSPSIVVASRPNRPTVAMIACSRSRT